MTKNKDECPKHKTPRAHGFCFECSKENAPKIKGEDTGKGGSGIS